MLFALAHPVALAGLLAGFAVGITVHGVLQSALAARFGDRAPSATGRSRADPRRHLDPFGAVAAAIAGVGWGRQVNLDRRRFRSRAGYSAVIVAGPLANLALGAGALGAYRLIGGNAELLAAVTLGSALQPADGVGLPAAETLLLLFGLCNVAVGLLTLVPLPPLDGGRLLFAYAPRTAGWMRAEYVLAEQNWGVGILLVLLLVPLVGRLPLLLVVLDALASPLLRALAAAG